MKKELPFKGAIFDMDGVVTRTAHVHSLAWKEMFDEFLKKDASEKNHTFIPFSEAEDYLAYVDGKPRYEGVRSFLESRGLDLPFGTPEDAPQIETVCGLGNRKNVLFQEILNRDGAEVFESSLELINELKEMGIKIGLATSSKNCALILQKADLADMFEVVVDGVRSAELHLKGKPDPDIFVTAAKELGLFPEDCILVEDAISGVEAGKKGNFGLVLGVARAVSGEKLRKFGADIVIGDLQDISLDDILYWFEHRVEKDSWYLTYYGYDESVEKLREALTVVGNGYFGTRGNFVGERASSVHYPGTYIAGLYNKLPTELHGTTIFNNDFVNCPDWTSLRFRIGNGEFQSPLDMDILNYRHRLYLKDAVMEHKIICRDTIGRITHIHTKRIASMDNHHLAAISYEIIPLNYTANITVRSELNGNIINEGVDRYKKLNSRHLDFISADDANDMIQLHVRTNHSQYDIHMAARHRFFEKGQEDDALIRTVRDEAMIGEEIRFHAVEGDRYTIEKTVSIHTSLDQNVSEQDPGIRAKKDIESTPPFLQVFRNHQQKWHAIWDNIDIRIKHDRFSQRAIRLHMYHLICTASPHNKDIDAGLTARGLHGEAYRGHVFWDELYVYPFYNTYFPEITRSLLMYRYHRLDAARDYAREHGHEGAMFPWQTADDGKEETQVIHYNPMSGNWDPDLSSRQRHVSIAIFYNIWTYVNHTQDKEFLNQYGAEMMLEITRFWSSVCDFDEKDGRYHISGVMGPDEYHEKMPDSDDAGITDNAYTNIMVVWIMEKMIDMIELMDEKSRKIVYEKIGFNHDEVVKWRDVSKKMNVIIDENGIISQFKGYMSLPELDWDSYRKKYGNIHRMDRILKSEEDTPDHYKVAKQADVLMLYYLLAPEKVRQLLVDIGYQVPDAMELLKRNYEYYVHRTSHGSTLSKVVHATVSRYVTHDGTVWDWFMGALKSDIEDSQGGTTLEGIHCGVMAGTIEIVVRNFCGVAFEHDRLVLQPNLPDHWKEVSFCVWHHGIRYDLILSHASITVTASDEKRTASAPEKIILEAAGKMNELQSGHKQVITY